jgi:hypothetical protein
MLGLYPRGSAIPMARMAVCQRCGYFAADWRGMVVGQYVPGLLTKPLPAGPGCAMCKCYLPLKVHVSWAACPLGYWPAQAPQPPGQAPW